MHCKINLTKSGIGYIYFYDEKKKEFTLNTWSQDVMPQCTIRDKQKVYQLEKTGIWGEAVRQRRPLIVNDFAKENPLKKGYPQGHVPLRKYMTVPIFDGGQIVAVIGLANKGLDYNEVDVWQVTMLMNSVWATVERKKSEIALREEKERLRATLLSVGDGVIATDEEGRVEIMNKVAENLTGWPGSEALGRPFTEVFNIVDEGTGEHYLDPITSALTMGKSVDPEQHAVLYARDGEKRYIAASGTPIEDESSAAVGAVLVFRDVGEERKHLAEIEYLSRRDHLTGVYNRRYFEEKLKELDTARHLPLSIVMADLDGLKMANDSLGHAFGDKILRRATALIQENCRQGDIMARWGGDEFVLVLPRTDEQAVEALGMRIERMFTKEKIDAVPLSISLGWATKTRAAQLVGSVFKKAEDRMYRAKLWRSSGIRGDIIQALMAALYEKDPREEEHCQRVSKLSQLLGAALGLSKREIKELEIIGLFHDIGKVCIPEAVLHKKEALTAAEWKEIKRHPEVGYRVLSNVQDLSDVAQYVLAHHERWDGAGYPRGLKGEEIPLPARIIAVADAYDAMRSYRPYKASLSKKEALAELQRCAGTQFDPWVVQAFIKTALSWDED